MESQFVAVGAEERQGKAGHVCMALRLVQSRQIDTGTVTEVAGPYRFRCVGPLRLNPAIKRPRQRVN